MWWWCRCRGKDQALRLLLLLSKGLKVACRENEVDVNAWLMPEHLRPFMSTVCPAVLAPLPETVSLIWG